MATKSRLGSGRQGRYGGNTEGGLDLDGLPAIPIEA